MAVVAQDWKVWGRGGGKGGGWGGDQKLEQEANPWPTRNRGWAVKNTETPVYREVLWKA